MKPPICKVCGTEHWSGAPHYSGKPATAVKTTLEIASAAVASLSSAKVIDGTATVKTQPVAAPKPGRGRPISDAPKSPRAEYQRELMRKRRAAAKEAKP